MLGYPPYHESVGFNATSKKVPSEEDRLAITELLNRKQMLMVEMQHYESNAASEDLEERPATAMPTNTRLQVAVTPNVDEVMIALWLKCLFISI